MPFKSTQGTDTGKFVEVFRSVKTVLGQKVGRSGIKIASGGSVRSSDTTPDFRSYHVFTQPGTFATADPITIDLMLVGGGAGNNGTAGGGGGGVVVKINFTVEAGSYPIVVGPGGGPNGGGYDTSAFGLVAFGGGPGIPIGSPRGNRGGSGSGGGGTGTNPTTPALLGGPFPADLTQGYNGGGNGPSGPGGNGGGGGGGAGAAGSGAGWNVGGPGGSGLVVPQFPGTIVNPLLVGASGGTYGGGGGGGAGSPPGGPGDFNLGQAGGGAGGGGAGTRVNSFNAYWGPNLPASPGTNYLGGGGGGGTSTSGGSGIVMIRYFSS